jgi:hypothetical protein
MLGNGQKNIGYESNIFKANFVTPIYPNPIVTDFKERVISNGGSITSIQETACINLVNSLINNNLWSKMKIIYPFVGGSAASCAVNLVDSLYKATFSSGWTFTALGCTPTGANTFLTTNTFNPSLALSTHSTSFSYYSRTNNNGAYFELGVVDNLVGEKVVSLANRYNSSAYSDLNDVENAAAYFEAAVKSGDMKSVPWLVTLLEAHKPNDPQIPTLKEQMEKGNKI